MLKIIRERLFILFALLVAGGMPVVDAWVHTFSTAGTGGFSNWNSGMNVYSSSLQIIIAVFMLIFSINFES